jgi:hypothetical protein
MRLFRDVEYITWSVLCCNSVKTNSEGLINHCVELGICSDEIDKSLEVLKAKIQIIQN